MKILNIWNQRFLISDIKCNALGPSVLQEANENVRNITDNLWSLTKNVANI